MHETPADLEALQALLDAQLRTRGRASAADPHPERRLDAAGVAERLRACACSRWPRSPRDGRPIAGPVDGIFYRGAFHFGSSPDSVRFRHIRARPQVSATHLPGEELAVTVHGRAVPSTWPPEHAELRRTMLDIYVPRYGAEWERNILDSGASYARIDAERMFAFHMGTLPGRDSNPNYQSQNLACCQLHHPATGGGGV